MTDHRTSQRDDVAMTFPTLVEKVRRDGGYATTDGARDVTLTVLAALGRQLTGDERVALAGTLPFEAAVAFAGEVPATRQLAGGEFIGELADRTGNTSAVARWQVGVVFSVVAELAGPALMLDILHHLPDGYALLFGRAELRSHQGQLA
ncbi:DUF2267 domain-containing protein [Streptomyces noursei]